jgi:serine/threonine-protein kinase RsbW
MATNINDRMVKITLPNIMGYERIAMASSASLAKMFGFSSGRIEDLKTIVAEAATNAMQHGNKGCTDSEITVTIGFKDNAIQVAVTDQGNGFEEILPKPDIDHIMSHPDSSVGFGVFLIQELADEVEFNTDTEGGHCVNIVVKKDSK